MKGNKATLLSVAAKAVMGKKKSGEPVLDTNKYHVYDRVLHIKAGKKEVADQIQQSLQEIIEKASPTAIEKLANTLAKKPKLVDSAVHWLPLIS
jgi:adenine-specific DNA glycosylase